MHQLPNRSPELLTTIPLGNLLLFVKSTSCFGGVVSHPATAAENLLEMQILEAQP